MSGSSPGRSRRRFAVVGSVHAINATAEPQLAIWWPYLQAALFLSSTELTLLQLCLPVGLWLGASFGGWLAGRVGTRRALALGILLFIGALPAVMLVSHAVLAGLLLLALGFGNGIYDVVQGTVTSLLEDTGGRRHTVLFKAVFSFVAFGAASAAGLVVAAGATPLAHLASFAAVVLAVLYGVVLWLLPDVRPEPELEPLELGGEHGVVASSVPATPSLNRQTLPLALLAAAAALPLGVLYTRGAFIFESLGATGGARNVGLAVFSIAQGVVQLVVWRASARVKARRTAVVGGWVAVAGAIAVGTAAVGLGGWVLAAIGITLVGGGLAAVSPMAQSVAGQRFTGQRTRAIASVVRLNHFGIAAAPGVVLLVSFAFAPLMASATASTLAAAVVLLACAAAVALFAGNALRDH